MSQALDHVGVFARSLADTALILEVLAGYDPEDPDTRPVAAPAFLERVAEEPPMPPRFAFVRTPVWDKADAETRAAFEDLVERLGDSRQRDRPAGSAMPPPGTTSASIMAADMAHNLGAVVERGGEASSKTLRDLLAEGSEVTRGALSGGARCGAALCGRPCRNFQRNTTRS